MRRFFYFLFIVIALAALALTLLAAESALARILQVGAAVLVLVVILDRVLGLFHQPNMKIPPSQIAEIERLYFRSMREMLSDQPNLMQVVNDLQRILALDANYKNARHYLNRALILQTEQEHISDSPNGQGPNRAGVDFQRIQEQLIDPDPIIRKSVVMELIQFGPKAVDPLIALLMDEDSDVRVHAATALGWVGGKDAVQPLMVALQDSVPYVRRYAARAMCWVVDETAIEGLIEALHDGDNYVRRYAARALGWSQDRRSVRPLLELLAYEENSDVREYAMTALEDLGENPAQVERRVELTE